MNFHPTPPHIVQIIRRHIPKRKITTILEPAAGEGALLGALHKQLGNSCKLVLLDIDRNKCELLKNKSKRASVINTNFLKHDFKNTKFDLIITNPPFSGRSEDWIDTSLGKAPLEGAFILKCLSLLSENGTLIAIVPDSLVNSIRHKKFRELFFKFNLKYSYQLPEKTFPRTEGRFFLLVLSKMEKFRFLCLRKISSFKEEEIRLKYMDLKAREFRLDYDYHSVFGFGGVQKPDDIVFTRHKEKIATFNFISIKRGAIRTDYKGDFVIHSTNYDSGFWNVFSKDDKKPRRQDHYLIACKRVSRDANYTFGLMPVKVAPKCTDCLILMSPPSDRVFEALFYLRTMFSCEDGAKQLLRGSGAKFIPVNDLKEILLCSISDLFQKEFKKYIDAYFNLQINTCMAIESNVRNRLLYGDKVRSITVAENDSSENAIANIA